MKHLIEFFIGTSFLVNSAFAPLITQQPVPDSVCMTDTAEFIVKVLPNTTLQWQFSSNPSDPMSWGDLIVGVSGAQTDTLKVTQPGMYIGDYFRVLVMDTTSTFSETSDSVFLTVFPNPTVELMSVPSGFAFCEGSSIILQTTDMNPLNSHLWAPTGETTSTINVTTGNIIYSVTVTDVNLCSGSSAHLVMENPKPTPQILPIEAEVKFCPGKTLQLMSDSTIYTNYTWSSSPGDTQAFITVSVIGNYMLTVTDGNGCTASTSRVVGVYQPTSQPSISPIIKEFCQGDNLWLVGNSGYSDYVWSTGLHNDSLLISSEGIYTLTVADVNGCTATNTAQTKANALPLSAFSSYPTNLISPPVRVTQVLTFTDQSTSTEGNIVNWNWDFDTGAVPPSAFYSVSQNRPEVFYNEEGLKKVCLEIRNQKGCL
ncbi:MAG: hypothetical protein ABJB16_11295, partial [Saprospiraceae bacterium]